MSGMAPYLALALQTICVAINDLSGAAETRPRMLAACARIASQIAASKRFAGADVRLVVLPEYVLTGFPMGETAAQWADKAAIDMDGPEYKALGAAAKAADVFLAGNAYERDPHFPGLYFQTCFIIAPHGDVILRYRRLISLFAPSPYDVLDKYVGIYGRDALFPVVETELGCLAAIASEEILYPEIARALAVRGAEVFVHSSSEVASPLSTPKNIAKQARAIENLAYIVSANTAGVDGIAIPKSSADGGSKIVDYRGLVLSEAGLGESMAAYAEIDIAALRRFRRRPGMANTLSRQPMQLWASIYAEPSIQPPNTMIAEDGTVVSPTSQFYAQRQQRVIATLIDRKIIR